MKGTKEIFGLRVRTLVLAIIVLVAGFGAWWALTPADGPALRLRADDRAVVALGKQVYVNQCAACHGARLEGQPDWKLRNAQGLLPAPPHDESGHTWHHPDQVLFEITKYGVQRFAGSDYATTMPRYEGVLTDEQIVAVLSYVKASWSDAARSRQELINESALRRR